MAADRTATDARTAMLNSIRQALTHQDAYAGTSPAAEDATAPWFVREGDDPVLLFAEKFTELSGHFGYCEHLQEAAEKLNHLIKARGWHTVFCAEAQLRDQLVQSGLQAAFTTDLAGCHASITSVEALIARTGSLLISSAQAHGRTASAYAPVHVALARTAQVVYDLEDALAMLQEKYGPNLPSFVTVATGPSRTADIEKTLVTGVHGPGEVYCLLVEDQPT